MKIGTGMGCLIIGGVLWIVATVATDNWSSSDSPATTTPAARSSENQAWNVLAAGETRVKEMLKDPGSAKFGAVEVFAAKGKDGQDGMVACGTVNAKNGFGGYSGATRFVSTGAAAGTFLESSEGGAFQPAWDGFCKGTPIIRSHAE